MLLRSGVGFNLKGTHMIIVNDELWKLIVKSWAILDDWKEIFGKDRATGESVEDVMEAVNELLREDNEAHDGGDGGYHVNLDGISENEEEDDFVCQGDKSAPPVKSATNKKHKSTDGIEGVYDLLGDLCHATDTRLENIPSIIGYKFDWGKAKKTGI